MYIKLGTDYRYYNGNYYEVNATKSGINDKILNSFFKQLAAMESRHNKLFVYIFIPEVKESNCTNSIMKDFNSGIERHFNKFQKTKEMAYLWVREKVNNKPEHYHQVIILDGNKVRNIKHIYQPMLDIWQSVGGSNIHRPERPYYNYRRGDYETMANIIYRVSYLAKNATKGDKPAQTKNYSSSRIKFNGTQ